MKLAPAVLFPIACAAITPAHAATSLLTSGAGDGSVSVTVDSCGAFFSSTERGTDAFLAPVVAGTLPLAFLVHVSM